MSNTLVVTRKEIRQLLGARSTLFTGIGMALFFGVMYSLRIGQEGGGDFSSRDGRPCRKAPAA